MADKKSNDQRSNVYNPTSSDNKAAGNNKSNQMNPNNSAYRKSRGKQAYRAMGKIYNIFYFYISIIYRI